jgi:hypothetical protein
MAQPSGGRPAGLCTGKSDMAAVLRKGWTAAVRQAQSAAMRIVLAFGLLAVLAGCSGGPAAYGITGPGSQPVVVARPAETPDTAPTPGVTTTGTSFGPSNQPTTGTSGFWGYNN